MQKEEQEAAAIYDSFVDSFKVNPWIQVGWKWDKMKFSWIHFYSIPLFLPACERTSVCSLPLPQSQAEEEKAAASGGIKTFLRGGTVMPGQKPPEGRFPHPPHLSPSCLWLTGCPSVRRWSKA